MKPETTPFRPIEACNEGFLSTMNIKPHLFGLDGQFHGRCVADVILQTRERDFFIDSLLTRIHFMIIYHDYLVDRPRAMGV